MKFYKDLLEELGFKWQLDNSYYLKLDNVNMEFVLGLFLRAICDHKNLLAISLYDYNSKDEILISVFSVNEKEEITKLVNRFK